jgi:hypothetical protein
VSAPRRAAPRRTTTARATRSRRGPRRLVITLLVLAVLLVALDRGSCWIAERQVASKFQTSQHLSTRPSVTIGGFPFLTQLAGRDFSDVRIKAAGLVVAGQGRPVRITDLAVDLRQVRPSSNFSSATAGSGSGTARLGYADLSAATGFPTGYAGSGKVKATSSVQLLGQKVSGSVSTLVGVSGGNTLTFGQITADVAGAGIPQQLTDALAALLAKPVSLHGLPAGLRITKVTADASGLAIIMSASNLALG